MRLAPLFGLLLWSACGSSQSAPPAAPSAPTTSMESPAPGEAEAGAAAMLPEESPPPPETPAPAPEPLKLTFPERGGVEAAIKAVPRGAPRLNMSNDALQGPLLDMRRYDRCKVPRSTKVTLNVAVYDGSAVGVDVETKPANAKLNDCLDRVVREMSWDKVPSLNQVTVSF